MSLFKEFTTSSARPLPVIILADVSGSMQAAGKIDALNGAVREMIAAFADETATRVEIQVGVITFGLNGAAVHLPLTPASRARWDDLRADGCTPLAAALEEALRLVEDRERIPPRAYRPVIVLASDGQPTDAFGQRTDDWRAPLQRLLDSERGRRADRLALAIGDDADQAMLREFIADPEKQVFPAADAGRIREFFRVVTMSVTSRSRSVKPDEPAFLDLSDVDH